jgi:hypothetical protein
MSADPGLAQDGIEAVTRCLRRTRVLHRERHQLLGVTRSAPPPRSAAFLHLLPKLFHC